MTTNNAFPGLPEDLYRFFWELAFQNNPQFFEANRARYLSSVKAPLYQLAACIVPAALDMDPAFSTKPSHIVSRIRRDTRYSHDKSPYRDHAWLSFRYPGNRIGVSFTPYVEFERESYGYGMGMYSPDTERMEQIRFRILAAPDTFLRLVNNPKLKKTFTPEGERYKRLRFHHENEALIPWLNYRSLSFCFSSPELSKTMTPGIVDEINAAFQLLKPLYQFLIR